MHMLLRPPRLVCAPSPSRKFLALPCSIRGHGCRKSLQVQAVRAKPCELGFRVDIADAYDVLDPVGSGGFGTVYRGVQKRSGFEVAIKTMSKTRGSQAREDTLDKLCREVSLLQSVSDCPGVAHFLDCFEDQDHVHLVTDICNGGDLKTYVETHGPLDESTLAVVAFEVLQMLKGCHARGILYADVKPANLCLTDACAFSKEVPSPPFIRAVDFGCSQRIGSGRLRNRTGTLAFMAPEVFLLNFAYKADVWSLGITLYWLFAARVPFWDNAEMAKISAMSQVTDAVNKAPIPYDYGPWLHMSAEGLDFMRACLTRPEKERMSVDEALQHPWLAKYTKEMQMQALVNASIESASSQVAVFV